MHKLKNGGPVQTRTVIKRLTAARSNLWTTEPWSERQDSDLRSSDPKSDAITKLRYFPINSREGRNRTTVPWIQGNPTTERPLDLIGCGSGESNQNQCLKVMSLLCKPFHSPAISLYSERFELSSVPYNRIEPMLSLWNRTTDRSCRSPFLPRNLTEK